jgi:2,4-dienoyl-CoA reductase-like NADH-dependent reductase (Old Yellow Enzyme family)
VGSLAGVWKDCIDRCACQGALGEQAGPSYQVPLARAVKAAVRIPVVAVGLITGFEQAKAIVGTGDADLIALARTILHDPRWHTAAKLGGQVRAPHRNPRSQPRQFPDLFESE